MRIPEAVVYGSLVEECYCKAPKWRLTTKYHGNTMLLATLRGMAPQRELKWEILGRPMRRFFGLLLLGLAYVAVPGALIGLIAGLFGEHHIAAIVWGLLILLTHARSWIGRGKVDALTYFLAAAQGIVGAMSAFFVGNALQ